MKISSIPSDPHYHPRALEVKVFLDGVERMNVAFADEESRHAKVVKLDSDGKVKLDKNGNILLEEFFGHVRIEKPDDWESNYAAIWPFPTSGSPNIPAQDADELDENE